LIDMKFFVLPLTGFLISFIFIETIHASDYKDYCSEKKTHVALHLIKEGLKTNAERKRASNVITAAFRSLPNNTRISIFTQDNTGIRRAFSGCRPACKKVGLLNELIINKCSQTVAKKDEKRFTREFVRSMRAELKVWPTNKMSLIQLISRAGTFHQTNLIDGKYENFILITRLTPFSFELDTSVNLDQKFVEYIQSIEKLPKALSRARFKCTDGSQNSTNLINFWNDIFEVFEINSKIECI